MTNQLTLRVATPAEIESVGGASDGGLLIYFDGVLLGWADDYGTVRHPDHEMNERIRDLAESLVDAAGDLLAEIAIPAPGRPS